MKRVSIFCGHYGSGKTNVSINYAFELRRKGLEVSLADLDIVNPYFRSADSRSDLESAGINVVCLPYANSNVDLPAVPSAAYGLFQNRNQYAVLDIGGDDRGSYVLGRFAPLIKAEDNYDMFLVVNFYRPLTRNADEAFCVMREIEAACCLEFTGIINNSNLGGLTDSDNVRATYAIAESLSAMAGIPVVCTTAFEKAACDNMKIIKLQDKFYDIIQ